MDPWKNWTRSALLWAFCCHYLFLLAVASPVVPLEQTGTLNNHSCSLNRYHFQRPAFRNLTYSVAKQTGYFVTAGYVSARIYDKDTVNRFVGQHLYTNVTRNERCYLMKRVTNFVLMDVLSTLRDQHPNLLEVTSFFEQLNAELRGCKPVEDETYIEENLKRMKDKLEELGENGKKKVVGELDLLFDYLEDACTSKKGRRVPQCSKMN